MRRQKKPSPLRRFPRRSFPPPPPPRRCGCNLGQNLLIWAHLFKSISSKFITCRQLNKRQNLIMDEWRREGGTSETGARHPENRQAALSQVGERLAGLGGDVRDRRLRITED